MSVESVFNVTERGRRNPMFGHIKLEIKALLDEGICISQITSVSPQYAVREAFSEADCFVFTRDPRGKINAFAILRFFEHTMKTYVVCSDSTRGGSAKPVVLETLRLARARHKVRGNLDALPGVETYYMRFGYKFVGSDTETVDGVYPMYKNMSNTVNYHELQKPNYVREVPKVPKAPKMPVVIRLVPRFQDHAIVWARVEGYPWWPAQVQKPDSHHVKLPHSEGDVFVVFWGTGEVAWMHPSQVADYVTYRERYGKGRKSAELTAAIAIADDVVARLKFIRK